jgi:hypothetical protein
LSKSLIYIFGRCPYIQDTIYKYSVKMLSPKL